MLSVLSDGLIACFVERFLFVVRFVECVVGKSGDWLLVFFICRCVDGLPFALLIVILVVLLVALLVVLLVVLLIALLVSC